ncbi:hypothetical protein BV22DRAFT_1028277 [Leucogyrophana mollusca]|uniref:Uncharacterized protein n=1 Tax=Leucogyrophana mollusca TaxID=85980 RepID=A0ACB8BYS4_9AGAM|nr:hypothetical protein BV22DRAFT_1028277 [Leucogyrophana mollusca]
MFMSMISHLLCAWFAFLLPCYSTFKALSHAPLSGELEKLSMYWAVIGAFVAIEHTVGPFISWFPFYWELRTIFLLYLSLPQTEGSTYIYKSYLQPFCARNEAELDSGIAAAQHNVVGFCQSRFSSLLDIFWSLLNKTPVTKQFQKDAQNQTGATGAGGYSLDSVKSLWNAYGPTTFGGLSKSFTKPGSSSSVPPTAHASGAEVNHNGGHERKFAEPSLDPAVPPPPEGLSAHPEVQS